VRLLPLKEHFSRHRSIPEVPWRDPPGVTLCNRTFIRSTTCPVARFQTRALVVGAGAFGGWTALHLLRRGVSVTLCDAWGPANPRAKLGRRHPGHPGDLRPDRIYVDLTIASFPQLARAPARDRPTGPAGDGRAVARHGVRRVGARGAGTPPRLPASPARSSPRQRPGGGTRCSISPAYTGCWMSGRRIPSRPGGLRARAGPLPGGGRHLPGAAGRAPGARLRD